MTEQSTFFGSWEENKEVEQIVVVSYLDQREIRYGKDGQESNPRPSFILSTIMNLQYQQIRQSIYTYLYFEL